MRGGRRGGGGWGNHVCCHFLQLLSLWDKAALSPNEYVAERNYKCITNSPLLCMSGYVYSRVTSLRMSEERLLVPRDGLFDTMKVTTRMPSCTILRKPNLLQCFIYKFVQGEQNYSMAK